MYYWKHIFRNLSQISLISSNISQTDLKTGMAPFACATIAWTMIVIFPANLAEFAWMVLVIIGLFHLVSCLFDTPHARIGRSWRNSRRIGSLFIDWRHLAQDRQKNWTFRKWARAEMGQIGRANHYNTISMSPRQMMILLTGRRRWCSGVKEVKLVGEGKLLYPNGLGESWLQPGRKHLESAGTPAGYAILLRNIGEHHGIG